MSQHESAVYKAEKSTLYKGFILDTNQKYYITTNKTTCSKIMYAQHNALGRKVTSWGFRRIYAINWHGRYTFCQSIISTKLFPLLIKYLNDKIVKTLEDK